MEFSIGRFSWLARAWKGFSVKIKMITLSLMCGLVTGSSLFGMDGCEIQGAFINDEKPVQQQQIPVLVKVQMNDAGVITKILELQALTQNDIQNLLFAAGSIQGDPQGEMTLRQSLRLFVEGTRDIIKGTCYLILLGGRWLTPYIVDATKAAVPSARALLKKVKDCVTRTPAAQEYDYVVVGH